ncbi:FAD/NAD(P)-binding domain-containing protein [Annulohypoxylon truncatum]|uniref:FAD/NAD(P)-binding domain-containing protein n=1 Tax=Annulohypoxylon truncatum TaxID=327061 RepID=UPI0020079A8A|nr:FAD/NAD(P)-binding domain-containing protein [Annulohypoxylon truncatum]KAI1213995.1 FAD/NAD(P)-binding domain-containing protein [Annulohypoxylon truncatum]
MGEFISTEVKEPYTIREEPLGTTKHVRIVGIGAGASGINMIRTLRRNLTNYEHVIYEKNEKVGGTWFENRYPGCRCDVPSHNYQFSWRPNHEWSNFFAPAAEIEQYLTRIVEEEHMADTIKTRHKVVGAWWDEARGIWDLSVQNLETGEEFRDQANFVVDASGILNNWKWPDIPNIKSFRGELVHTASWPKDFDYNNKNVAIIGNGSSGIQLLPTIQPDVKKLYHFVRTPTWVIPPRIVSMMTMGGPAKDILGQIELDEKENFTQRQIEKFKADPAFYRKFVKTIEQDSNGNFALIQNNSPVQAFATSKVIQYMTATLGGDEKLCKALIPQFPLGCRRITPAPGYLEALRSSNTEVITEGIAEIVPEGIRLESGQIIQLDAIICATGFDNSFAPRFPIVGRHGNVQDAFKNDTPKGYMSCALAGVPNYFSEFSPPPFPFLPNTQTLKPPQRILHTNKRPLAFLGPNGPIGHGSVFTLSEHIARYITRIILKCQTEQIRSVAPTSAAVSEYAAHVAALMPRVAWSGPCKSWFKKNGNDGAEDAPVTALHPGSRVHFFHMLERFRGEDWEYVYDGPAGNRFWYLGNGFSTRELGGEEGDQTWYLEEEADRL